MLNRAYHLLVEKKEIMALFFSQLLFGMLGALILHVVFFGLSSSRLATVNITDIQSSFLHETMNQGLNTVQMKEKVTKFASILNNTLIELAKRKNLILVPSEAVIAGTNPDYTAVVVNQIKLRLSR